MNTKNKSENKASSTLYKFRDWNNNYHRTILIDNKFYLPLIQELNDPFDYQLTLSMTLIDTDEKIDELVNLIIESAKKDSSLYINQQNELKIKRETINLIQNDSKSFLEQYMSKVKKLYIPRISVLSLSEVWDNILLWTHYSNNHSGFCIGFNKEKLDDSLFFGSHGRVHYDNNYPTIDIIKWNKNDLETMLIESHTKSIDWSYEREYRYTKLWFPDIPTINIRTMPFDDSFINEIIVGLNISPDNEEEIREICSRKNIPLYKIQKSNSQFILERNPL